MCDVCVKTAKDIEEILRLPDGDLATWTQGLLVTDSVKEDNPIVFANHAFENITGYVHSEIMGRNCRFLQGQETDRAVVLRMRNAIEQRERFDGDVLNYRKDGTPFWNRVSIGPARSALGETRYFLGMQMDASKEHGLDVVYEVRR